jgi:hypothetical protein
MAISAAYESSASISTNEYSCPAATISGVPTSQTADGVYQVWLDLNALIAGDHFRARLYEKVQSAGTQRIVEEWNFVGAQGKPHWVSPSLILLHGWDFTIIKVAGTDRTIGWSIRQVA